MTHDDNQGNCLLRFFQGGQLRRRGWAVKQEKASSHKKSSLSAASFPSSLPSSYSPSASYSTSHRCHHQHQQHCHCYHHHFLHPDHHDENLWPVKHNWRFFKKKHLCKNNWNVLFFFFFKCDDANMIFKSLLWKLVFETKLVETKNIGELADDDGDYDNSNYDQPTNDQWRSCYEGSPA